MDFSSSNLGERKNCFAEHPEERRSFSRECRLEFTAIGRSHLLGQLSDLLIVQRRGARRIALDGIDGEIGREIFCLDKGRFWQEVPVFLVSAVVDGSENVLMSIFDVSFQRASIAIRSIALGHSTFVRFLFLMRQHMSMPGMKKRNISLIRSNSFPISDEVSLIRWRTTNQ